MKNIIKTISTIFIIVILGFLVLTSFSSPEENIIGTWVLEDDNSTKWVFTDDHCYWYYNDTLEDTFTYTIQDLSNAPSSGSPTLLCGQAVKTGNTEDFYLKLIDLDDDEYCYEIFGLDNEKLSINFLGQAEIKVFNKE